MERDGNPRVIDFQIRVGDYASALQKTAISYSE